VEQVGRYGRFVADPTPEELEKFFFLDADALARVRAKRRLHNRLGWSIQWGTARMLGTFLTDSDPVAVPEVVIRYTDRRPAATRPPSAAVNRRRNARLPLRPHPSRRRPSRRNLENLRPRRPHTVTHPKPRTAHTPNHDQGIQITRSTEPASIDPQRAMKKFTSARHAQRFLSAFSGISPHFRPGRHRLSAQEYRREMTDRFTTWNQITGTATAA
jgi:hypothetical protein